MVDRRPRRRRRSLPLFAAALGLLIGCVQTHADATSDRARAAIDKGLAYLKSQQKPDGSWQSEKDPPAMTAVVVKAFVQDKQKYNANTDFVKRGYDKLLSYQVEDGGIYKD